MKNGSSNVWIGEAWKCCPPPGVVAVASLDRAQTSHLQEIVFLSACLRGVITGNGSNQMHVVLDLTISTLEAGLVQWMVVSAPTALAETSKSRRPWHHCTEALLVKSLSRSFDSAVSVNNGLKQGLRS